MLVIEKKIHPSKARIPRELSLEYQLGTEMFNQMQVDDSTLLIGISPEKVRVRLERLNKPFNEGEKGSIRKVWKHKKEGEGYRFFCVEIVRQEVENG